MPVDTSIYGNQKTFTMSDPLDAAMKGTQLRAANRQFTLEDDISGALAESGGDYSKASQSLAQRGRGTAALQLGGRADAQKKAEQEANLKKMEAAASDGLALDAAYRQALSANGGDQQKAIDAIAPAYAEVRARWAPQGVNLPAQFDPVKNLAGAGQAKEIATYLKSINPNYGAPVAVTGPDGKPAMMQPSQQGGAPRMVPGVTPRETPTELSRLQNERDALPEGDQRRAEYDRVLEHYKAGRGDTNVTIQPPGPMAPGKGAANKVDEDLLGMTRHLMQIDQINAQFKPEFQRFQDKAGFAGLKVKDSTVGLTNKEKQDLSEYTTYRRNSFNSLNEYIKSITGAAMSEAEANRIRKSMPDPGDGLFGGDSPTEFKAKLDDTMKQTKMAVARLAYIKRNGMSLEDGQGKSVVPLDRMPSLINDRGQAIEKELKAAQPGVTDAALQRAVRRQLAVEFGLSND